ncbi:DciA family protein [Pseudazoarcus pumilus]|uniref:DUF721 domain-containing protein n=1 Tax=Pseudazoarcus pumilus TaxID=2067960 RepID=A0A2I6S8Q1_9RHOO|nr:DciA family protein [Pseudazoarcus pumilus]AUN95628.1 DUF721 domain-containing protein [Pseudazoarcus pumilus]
MSEPVQRFLGSGETLARLHDRARTLRRLQEVLARSLPGPLGEACSVANLKGDSVILIARSGSVASRLRHMAPSLTAALAAEGFAVTRVEVKVGVTVAPQEQAPRPSRTVGAAGRESLEKLIAQLPEGDALRASLQRLVDRSRPE